MWENDQNTRNRGGSAEKVRLPVRIGERIDISRHTLTPTGICELLDRGFAITGPGNGQRGTYFFRKGALYIYALIIPELDEPAFYRAAGTRDGLCELLTIACFQGGQFWEGR